MKLSIVMPVYNEEATLREIVARVLATPHEKELILVDDCSRDKSPEIIAELVAAQQTRHSSGAGDYGLRLAQCEWRCVEE